MTGDFIEESTASGVLVTTVNESDHIQHHLITRDGNEREVESDLSGFASGQYTVSVFVVDKDGLPHIRAASRPRRVSVENGWLSWTTIFLTTSIYIPMCVKYRACY